MGNNRYLDILFTGIEPFNQLIESVRNGGKSLSIKYLNGSSISLLVNNLQSELDKPVVVVSNNTKLLEDVYFDLDNFFELPSIANLIEKTKNVATQEYDTHYGKIVDALGKFENKSFVALCTPTVFNAKIPEKSSIVENKTKLIKGQSINFEELKNQLAYNGFERVDYVSQQGQFAVRGGILDIFPISFKNPIRLEFWGNEIDSIREFLADTQRSISEFDEINFISKVFHSMNTEKIGSLFEYIPGDAIIIQIEKENLSTEDEEFLVPNNFVVVNVNSLENSIIKSDIKEQLSFNSSIKQFAKHLQEITIKGIKIILCADGKIHLSRMKELIQDALFVDDSSDLANPEQTLNNIQWSDKTISQGFIVPSSNICIYTEHELFNRHRNVTSKSLENVKFSLNELKQLNIGDLIIHDDKGVGRFEGFRTVEIGGSKQDCIQLAFEGGDKLYVNLNYINKVHKYSVSEGELPRLSKLGSTEWARKKAKIKKKVKDISRGLIKLYANRKLQKGFAFDADNVWQKEFEASFIYEDTPDQQKATKEIKTDMESENPMDRLVCGDVGFGKTEVAIRAAFKAVQSNKQVAILIPTTVLAQQHYMSFKDRMGKYPITVETISRFRSKKEQTDIIKKLKDGKVDILIGTHRLLSKDIEFKDLGLLVIDEEQRFGVAAKEKLRTLRETLDTLTLTATPIPRTLNFSLMGARDLSIIETPPRNRLPVQTEIIEWSFEEIAEIIDNEIKREGQVFFVNDTVQDLEEIYTKLKMLLPSVRFGIAHGQMKSSELERIMQNFVAGKFDVLLTTKIVESGLDIPNANSMIINNAQNFGLAELYQLRGRVGRGNLQAYCYLIIPTGRKLNDLATKRLKAIEEFTDLGSGFNLSLRDMEIRGAGNLLGAEQSGAIYDIGFELYQKILEEAVRELKVEEFKHVFDQDENDITDLFVNENISIELDEDAFIPENYIKSDTDRFSYYKSMYGISSASQIAELKQELIDKYGKLPKEVENLLFVVKLRSAAVKTGLDKVIIKPNKIILIFPDQSNEQYYKDAFPTVLDYLQTIENAYLKQGKLKLSCEIAIDNRNEASELLWKLKKSMEFIEV